MEEVGLAFFLFISPIDSYDVRVDVARDDNIGIIQPRIVRDLNIWMIVTKILDDFSHATGYILTRIDRTVGSLQ